MTDPLPKLFGSTARVKLLRLFLFNSRQSFTAADAAARARVGEQEARSEISLFARVGLIGRVSRGKGVRWGLLTNFQYTAALQNMLLNAPARAGDIADRLRGAGVFKLVILSGIFVGEWEGHLDLLLVGERVKTRMLRDRIRRLEAELGKEIRYTLLSTEDFTYRLNMNDKLVRDILDYSHRIVVNRLQYTGK